MKKLALIFLVLFSAKLAHACGESENSLSVKVLSYENTDWNNQLKINFTIIIDDSLTLLDSFKLDSLSYSMQLQSALYLSGVFAKGDTIDTSFVIIYDSTQTPFYPQKIGFSLTFINHLGENESINAFFRVYFTPYYTIEVWAESEFNQQNRIWVLGENNPSKPYLNPNNIPQSNIPPDFELIEDWQDNFTY